MPEVHNKYHKTAPPGAVYIGRPSKWGNPFSVEKYGRDVALKMYRLWVHNKNQAELCDQARRELKGKDLVCFCKPRACHGDLLLQIANTPMPSNTTEGHYGDQEGSSTRAGT